MNYYRLNGCVTLKTCKPVQDAIEAIHQALEEDRSSLTYEDQDDGTTILELDVVADIPLTHQRKIHDVLQSLSSYAEDPVEFEFSSDDDLGDGTFWVGDPEAVAELEWQNQKHDIVIELRSLPPERRQEILDQFKGT